MKKFLAGLALAALALVACVGEGGFATAGDAQSVKVGFVISALNEPIMQAYGDYMEKAMKEQAAAAGYALEYIAVSSDGDVAKEFSNVQDMIGSGCDVVIINAIDNVASLAAVAECHNNGVKAIFFCR